MNEIDILKDLRYEDCTEDLQIIWDSCGKDTVVTLLTNASGLRIYIPKPIALKSLMNRYINEEIKTKSILTISKSMNVTPAYVKQYLVHG